MMRKPKDLIKVLLVFNFIVEIKWSLLLKIYQ